MWVGRVGVFVSVAVSARIGFSEEAVCEILIGWAGTGVGIFVAVLVGVAVGPIVVSRVTSISVLVDMDVWVLLRVAVGGNNVSVAGTGVIVTVGDGVAVGTVGTDISVLAGNSAIRLGPSVTSVCVGVVALVCASNFGQTKIVPIAPIATTLNVTSAPSTTTTRLRPARRVFTGGGSNSTVSSLTIASVSDARSTSEIDPMGGGLDGFADAVEIVTGAVISRPASTAL